MAPHFVLHEIGLLRLPSCQDVNELVQWLAIRRAAELCQPSGGANLPTPQEMDRATVITLPAPQETPRRPARTGPVP
jgi:hypothetical protein